MDADAKGGADGRTGDARRRAGGVPGGAGEARRRSGGQAAGRRCGGAGGPAGRGPAATAAGAAQGWNGMMYQNVGGLETWGPAPGTAGHDQWFAETQRAYHNEGGMVSAIPRYARGGSVDRPMQARRTASGGVDYDDWDRLHREAAKYDPSSGARAATAASAAERRLTSGIRSRTRKEAPKGGGKSSGGGGKKGRPDPDHTGSVKSDPYPDESTRRPGRVDPYPDEATRRPQPTGMPPPYEGGMGYGRVFGSDPAPADVRAGRLHGIHAGARAHVCGAWPAVACAGTGRR